MPAHKRDKTPKPAGRKLGTRTVAKGKAATTLPESMVTGKASPAKAALGDKPVFAYIASLPQPQRGIAERVDERQVAAWMNQVAAVPGVGGKKP